MVVALPEQLVRELSSVAPSVVEELAAQLPEGHFVEGLA